MPAPTVVLITGANQGLGFEISKKLGTEHKDYRIIMADRRRDAVEQAMNKLESLGCSVEPLVLDVTSDTSISEAVRAVEGKHGRVDVLINNAAISHGEDESRASFLKVLDTNVAGVWAVTSAFLPLMEKSPAKPRRIVVMGSGLGSVQMKADRGSLVHKLDHTMYTTSKAALNMLALHLLVRYEDDPSWKINICDPGFCGTNLNNYAGTNTPESGAINACRLATLGPDGETGTFSSKEGIVPW